MGKQNAVSGTLIFMTEETESQRPATKNNTTDSTPTLALAALAVAHTNMPTTHCEVCEYAGKENCFSGALFSRLGLSYLDLHLRRRAMHFPPTTSEF